MIKHRFLAVILGFSIMGISGIAMAVNDSDQVITQELGHIPAAIEQDDVQREFYEMTGDDAFLGSGASPVKTKQRLQKIMYARVTAYSSTPDQTDSTPFVMANGKRVYNGAIAANFLPFGTKVKIPKLFGDKIFVVEDRMHERFSDRMDIWMENRADAVNFGLRYTLIEIVG